MSVKLHRAQALLLKKEPQTISVHRLNLVIGDMCKNIGVVKNLVFFNIILLIYASTYQIAKTENFGIKKTDTRVC